MKILKNPLQAGYVCMIALAVLALFASGHVFAAVMLAPAVGADLEELAREMKSSTEQVSGWLKEAKEAHTEISRKMGEHRTEISAELKTAIDKVISDMNGRMTGLQSELTDLSQKATSHAVTAREEKSWGEQFIEGAQFKAAGENGSASSRRGVIQQEVKTVTSASAGGLIQSYREPGVVSMLREQLVVADLIPDVRVATSSVDYAVQTVRTNNAAPVAEGAAKPYSDYAWEQRTAVIRVLAHLAKITRQAMDDAPRLVGEINAELRYGLGFVKDRQYLYGTGVGQNLHGIMPQATAFAVPAGFAPRGAGKVTKIDVLRVAMLQNVLALLPADGIVLSPVDWADIEMQKTVDGAYLFANPQGVAGQRMWGLPVIDTQAMAAGDFLVGNFRMGATEYVRMGIELLLSTENVDDFEKNLATLRAEERCAIAVKRPQAFTKGAFAAAIADIEA